MVDVFISHGAVGCDAVIKIFRSSLKGVQFNLTGTNVPFSEIMTCFNAITTCLKKMCESGISQRLDFIEIVTEELQLSILGSPLYKIELDTTETLNKLREIMTISPLVCLIVLYYHTMIDSTLDEHKLLSYVTSLLALYDSFEILNTLTFFDRFLEDYLKADLLEKTRGFVYLSLCGDAITYVLENSLKSSDACRINNNFDDQTRQHCSKTSLQCAARFLSVSYAEAKVNLQIIDTTSRVFSSLVRVVESFHFEVGSTGGGEWRKWWLRGGGMVV
ncbi:hypothetical protein Tco_0886236 [Tanacetum coccineum]